MKTPKITLKYINKHYPNDEELGKFLRTINTENIVSTPIYNDQEFGKVFRKNLSMFESLCNLNVNSWE